MFYSLTSCVHEHIATDKIMVCVGDPLSMSLFLSVSGTYFPIHFTRLLRFSFFSFRPLFTHGNSFIISSILSLLHCLGLFFSHRVIPG